MDIDKALADAVEAFEKDPSDYWRWCYDNAQCGDSTSARELLECFVKNARGAVPASVIDYLAQAFSAYLTGTADIEKALLLTRPKGRPRGPGRDQVSMVAYMHLLMKRDGLSKSKAQERTCGDRHIDLRQLQRYDSENNAVGSWSVADLESMARLPVRAPDRPVKHRKQRSAHK